MNHSNSHENGQRSSRLTLEDNAAGDGLKKRLVLSGRIIESEVMALRQEGEQWLATLNGGPCEVDLDGVETASSIFLSLLLCWRRQARGQGLDIRFQGANDRLRALAVMSCVDNELPGLSAP